MKPFREPIPLAPFLAWCSDQERALRERIASEPGTKYAELEIRSRARHALLTAISWADEAGARRLHRYNNETVTGLAERDVIEDALDHAGAAFWEIYPDLDGNPAMEDRFCSRCRDMVTVGDDGVCPWCETPTDAEPPSAKAYCSNCDKMIWPANDGTCTRCGLGRVGPMPWQECRCGCGSHIRRFDPYGRRTDWVLGHAPKGREGPGEPVPIEPFAAYLERCLRELDPVEAVAAQHGMRKEDVLWVLGRRGETFPRKPVQRALWLRGKASNGTSEGWRPGVPRFFEMYPDDARSRVCPGCGGQKAQHAEMCKKCRRARGLYSPPIAKTQVRDELLAEARAVYDGGGTFRDAARVIIDRSSSKSVNALAATLGREFERRGWKTRGRSADSAAPDHRRAA